MKFISEVYASDMMSITVLYLYGIVLFISNFILINIFVPQIVVKKSKYWSWQSPIYETTPFKLDQLLKEEEPLEVGCVLILSTE